MVGKVESDYSLDATRVSLVVLIEEARAELRARIAALVAHDALRNNASRKTTRKTLGRSLSDLIKEVDDGEFTNRPGRADKE